MHIQTKTKVPQLCGLALLAVWVLAGTGCSSKPASASFASVVIPGKTSDEICKTTGVVFQEEGYQVRLLQASNMIFQKEASRSQALAYGGVIDTHYGSTTAIRVKASLVDMGMGSYRLQCQAYVVRDANDAFFAEETRLSNMKGGTYQKILNKVAERLK
jgi:hypothetical protein